MDDILLFGDNSRDEWLSYKEIFNVYCLASGMEFSPTKSSFIVPDGEIDRHIHELLPFSCISLVGGF